MRSREESGARKKQPTIADHLAYYAVRLLEITAEMQPHGKRALKLSRDDAWDIRTELLTVISRLRDVQARYGSDIQGKA